MYEQTHDDKTIKINSTTKTKQIQSDQKKTAKTGLTTHIGHTEQTSSINDTNQISQIQTSDQISTINKLTPIHQTSSNKTNQSSQPKTLTEPQQ